MCTGQLRHVTYAYCYPRRKSTTEPPRHVPDVALSTKATSCVAGHGLASRAGRNGSQTSALLSAMFVQYMDDCNVYVAVKRPAPATSEVHVNARTNAVIRFFSASTAANKPQLRPRIVDTADGSVQAPTRRPDMCHRGVSLDRMTAAESVASWVDRMLRLQLLTRAGCLDGADRQFPRQRRSRGSGPMAAIKSV